MQNAAHKPAFLLCSRSSHRRRQPTASGFKPRLSQTWHHSILPNRICILSSDLIVAIVQFAITLGGTVDGMLFDTRGYQGTFHVSAVLLRCKGLRNAIRTHRDASKSHLIPGS